MDTTDIALGTSAGPVSFSVDPDEVAAFASALNDGNPRYADGTAVPPTYTVAPALDVVHALPDYPPAVLAATRAIVHGEQEFTYHRPVRAGATVRISVERVGATATKAGVVVEQVVRVEDVAGALLLEQRWVPVLIADATGPDQGRVQAPLLFPDHARDRPVATLTVATSRDQTFRYAGASGDRNPMHVNDEVARGRGFPRKFNQGLLTLGLATTALVDRLAGGDPGRVARLATRFSAPAFPGDEVTTRVYRVGDTAQGGPSFAFETESAGRTVLRHGRFDLRP